MPNIFSVDVEDWYFLPENSGMIIPGKMKIYIDNFIGNMQTILSLLDKKNIKATFFVLGRVAEELPDLIKEIAGAGHEIACHGYDHKRVYDMTEAEFRKDIEKSISAIVGSCSIQPKGFRAPEFSITKNTLNVLSLLAEYGFQYDSSIYPFALHPNYGVKNSSLDPWVHDSGIIEFPMSCSEILGMRIPCSGGGYFRLYPYSVFRFLYGICVKQRKNTVFYFHPWELGISFPEEHLSSMSKFRYYNNIKKTLPRLNMLVNDFEFTSFEKVIEIN